MARGRGIRALVGRRRRSDDEPPTRGRRRREVVALTALAVVGFGVLGAGTMAILVARDEGPPPDRTCVRWKVNTARPVLLRTDIVAATRSGSRCGDALEVGRIGRDGPFRVTVGTDILWTSSCAGDRDPRRLDLRVGPEGELLALVQCPSDGTGAEPPPVELDLDALLAENGYPPFLQF